MQQRRQPAHLPCAAPAAPAPCADVCLYHCDCPTSCHTFNPLLRSWLLGPTLAAAEVAELIGEEGGEDAAQLLAALEPERREELEAVLGQFTFTLDPFQVKAVAELLGGKSGGPAGDRSSVGSRRVVPVGARASGAGLQAAFTLHAARRQCIVPAQPVPVLHCCSGGVCPHWCWQDGHRRGGRPALPTPGQASHLHDAPQGAEQPEARRDARALWVGGCSCWLSLRFLCALKGAACPDGLPCPRYPRFLTTSLATPLLPLVQRRGGGSADGGRLSQH